MRKLSDEEVANVHGAAGLTISAESIGVSVGGAIGTPFGAGGILIGGLIGGMIGNYLTGTRAPGSVSTSGIPYGASFSSPYIAK